MSNSRRKEFENRGIKLVLTNDGAKAFAKILKDGCPVKISCDGFELISCPYRWCSKYYTCEKCWNNWLKDFVQEE